MAQLFLDDGARVIDQHNRVVDVTCDTAIEMARRMVAASVLVVSHPEKQSAHTVGLTSRGLPELALLDYPYNDYVEVLTRAARSVLAHGRPAHRATLCGVGCRNHPVKAIEPTVPPYLWFAEAVYGPLSRRRPEVMVIVTAGPDGLFSWETPYTPSRRERRRATRRRRPCTDPN